MTREFREAVYGWSYDQAAHGSKESCIPFQLQALFARLQLSCQGAVSTKGLTHSFGWSGADAFTQHDVQELTCVLFDALEKSDRQRFVKINARLWQGKQNSFIQPVKLTHPDQRHARAEQFIDIQVIAATTATMVV
jgi:ubiquitin carboxyl-terminal hydrolase 7